MTRFSKNPWKKLSEKYIYKNSWLSLREDQVITPSGKAGIYSVVEANPAIGIVPLTENMETYLVGQYRYAINAYSWEIPEGGGKPGETNIETAKRELKEETGLTAEKWTSLGELYTSNCFTNEIGYIFLAEILHQGKPEPDFTEDLKIKKIKFSEAVEMVKNFEIKDALAIIGIMRVYEYLKKKNNIKAF